MNDARNDVRTLGPDSYGEALVEKPALPGKLDLLLGGEWVKPSGDTLATVLEAGTDLALATLPALSEGELTELLSQPMAVGRAGSVSDRAAAMRRLAEAVEANAPQLAALESLTTGRPIARTLHDDAPLLAAAWRCFAEWTHMVGTADAGEPVVVPVTANQSLLTCMDSLAPALACGRSVVFRAEPQAALPILRLMELVQEEVALRSLVSLVIAEAGESEERPVIRPALVFADSDLDQAVEGIVQQAFTPALPGEAPGCHLFVEESIEAALLDRLRLRLGAARIGSPLDPNTELGPLPTEQALAAFEASLTQAKSDGIAVERFGTPALLTAVRPDQTIARQALVGPGFVVISFRTPAEALAKLQATGSEVGATTIWTEKAGKGPALAREVAGRSTFCNTRDRLAPALTYGHAALIGGESGEPWPFTSARHLDAADFALEVEAEETPSPFVPFCNCRLIWQALGI
jgi:acyl-CoA reductase-like NAD-dependent aldehyde dehydrogenase